MVHASWQRPELVQMLLVAFSRRMCCSRVDSVSTKPRLPSASSGFAGDAAGHLADVFFLRREQAHIRPAEIQRIADRLAFAANDVRAHGAGRFDQAERHAFGKRRHHQRASAARGFADLGEIGDRAEHVRRLHDHGRDIGAEMLRSPPLRHRPPPAARRFPGPALRTPCARFRHSADARRRRRRSSSAW